MTAQLEGIGMTSRRTRMRLVQRLREGGIESDRVLEVIGQVPRHIFLDEALSHRPTRIPRCPSAWPDSFPTLHRRPDD